MKIKVDTIEVASYMACPIYAIGGRWCYAPAFAEYLEAFCPFYAGVHGNEVNCMAEKCYTEIMMEAICETAGVFRYHGYQVVFGPSGDRLKVKLFWEIKAGRVHRGDKDALAGY